MPVGYRILIIEDEEPVGEVLRRTIGSAIEDADIVLETDFDRARDTLRKEVFDAVILDLFAGAVAEGAKSGQQIWEDVWKTRLVPVIIHTAGDCELTPPIPEGHPLLKCLKKGAGSDEELARLLRTMWPYMSALHDVEDQFQAVCKNVLLDIAPIIWAAENDEARRQEFLLRTARRRVAALMDVSTLTVDGRLQSWEEYIVPPLGACLLTGDILREVDASWERSDAHRLVLSPSCDLVVRGGRAKIDRVLVAKCCGIEEYVQRAGRSLSSRLNDPQAEGYVPLPEYPLVVPHMAASLRDLELISIEKIGADKIFCRMASIDSPFREQLAWAYLQISSRPGVPERNTESWAEAIKQKGRQTGSRQP